MIIAICDDEQKECERIRDYVYNCLRLEAIKTKVDIYEPDEFEQLLQTL